MQSRELWPRWRGRTGPCRRRSDGQHDFVGRKIDGYVQPLCLLTRQAAEGLRVAQRRLLRQGYTLKVYDCYRPQRAVDHFGRWAKNLSDEKMKAEYIAERSGHSRGSTVDLTLVDLPPRPQFPYRPGETLVPCFAPDRFPDTYFDFPVSRSSLTALPPCRIAIRGLNASRPRRGAGARFAR
ncbi:M15 family metallopeptidase [Amycolatopsis sp. NPDC052450]|uniref:M15 family metallopeptidase n=1 Tax=Amycolatopsis sp. NPDC052450 TaxID=3363937 RepID=UPI0037C55CD7